MKTYKPVFILGSYRGGTSLLFRLLSESKELWSLYRESDFMWKKFFRHPDEKADTMLFEQLADGNFKNLSKTSQIVNPREEREYFDNHYNFSSYDNYALGYLGRVRFLREKLPCILSFINCLNYLYKIITVKNYRFIDKTPPDSYRVNLINAIYPDAKYIYLIRKKEANVKSLISAWTHKSKFRFAYRGYLTKGLKLDIAGYSGKVWKFFIEPNFQNYLQNKSIKEVCEFQYDDVHQHIQNALKELDPKQYMQVSFEDLLDDPNLVMQNICDFIDIPYDSKMQKLVETMPEVNMA